MPQLAVSHIKRKESQKIPDGSIQEKKSVLISYISLFIPFIIYSNFNLGDKGSDTSNKSKKKKEPSSGQA